MTEDPEVMAIFIKNLSECPLCRAVLSSEDGVVSFPAMVWNELDPLARVSDATVHIACLGASGLMTAAQQRFLAVQRSTGPGRRSCMLCSQQVVTPDAHIALGHLTDVESSPLHRFNLAQFHRDCLARWDGRQALIANIEEERMSGRWRGLWLEQIAQQLRSIQSAV
jgi:hypothetical protein